MRESVAPKSSCEKDRVVPISLGVETLTFINDQSQTTIPCNYSVIITFYLHLQCLTRCPHHLVLGTTNRRVLEVRFSSVWLITLYPLLEMHCHTIVYECE